MEDPYGYMPEPQPPTDDRQIYALQAQEERVKTFIEHISPENQLADLQMRIKGYIKDPLTKSWKKVNENAPEPHPMLVARYISFLSSIMNQNTTFSTLSPGEINGIMKIIIEWLTDDLDSNAEEYTLKNDYSERTRIGQLLLNNTFMALKRAQNGMESRRIFKALNVSESLSQQPQQAKWDFLKFWK
ncbi:hypothetical protein GF386_05430 [Candidatus Pacearchaeota archaeon]|nr:hypothetical protein [Candidatus Pacearchaeota archaeon]MBD3283532.1 hypothetical protein [Candidatus Pacearchaeota archaeon]